jgi:MYXO-CTERM domain-containing protein
VSDLAPEAPQREGGPVDGPPSRLPERHVVGVAALAVLAGFVLFSSGDEPRPEQDTARSVAMVLLALAMGAPLAWRRRRPTHVAAAVLVAALAYAVLLGPVPPFAMWFALFAVVVHVGPPRLVARAGVLTWLGAAVALVAGPVVHGRGAGGLLPTLLLTLVVALAAALVRAVRARLDALRQRAASLERERDTASREAVVEERLRIARDVHDLVGHGLSTVAIQASTARLQLDSGDSHAARERLVAVEQTSRACMREMRQLLGVLRDQDTARVPAPGLGDICELVQQSRAMGLDVELELGQGSAVPAAVGLAAYRIVQESLTNVRKHAPGATAAVRVAPEAGALDVAVVDRGGAAVVADSQGGAGLIGIRERVAALGGTVTAGPDGRGWRVHAHLPLNQGER